MLQLQDLRVDQVKESCIRVNTRELNRELYIGLLPYIPQTTGLCTTTTLAYPKWPYIYLKATIYIIYSMVLFLPEPSTIFYHGIWSCDCVTVTYDIPS